mgnify:CR=1 FL=1
MGRAIFFALMMVFSSSSYAKSKAKAPKPPSKAQKAAKEKKKHALPPKFGEKIAAPFVWCEVGGPPGGCLCFEPLPCPKAGCNNYDEELTNLEHALKTAPKNFGCKEAEIDSCGPWRFIYCDKGKEGGRLMAFDEGGKLRMLKRRSDTVEFCGNKSFISYAGEKIGRAHV